MLEQMLVAKSPFASVKPSQDISPKGFFLEINIRNKPPRPSAKIFRYVTLATLTAIPAVSTRDGYIVYFDWYRYGKKERTFEYKVYRESFVWAPMIPFSWVNAFTYHESEAFAGVIQQFFKDVSEYLESRKANSK